MTSTIGESAMGNRRLAIVKRGIVLALIVFGGASCRLGKPGEPGLTGPSMFGVTVTVAATPDLLPRDGRTTSKIVVSARDGANGPVKDLPLHLDVKVEGAPGALGVLSQTEVTTGSDGTATVLYTAPLPAPFDTQAATILIVATPVGTNAANNTSTSTTIRLLEVAGPTASFKVAPDPLKVFETAVFDASSSAPTAGHFITTYAWDFGDGNAGFVVATGPKTTHEYDREGTFTVRLTVIDSSGKNTTVTRTVVVLD